MHYQDLASASDWLCREGIFFQPIRSTTKIWEVHIISIEFLRSLLRRRFARAQVATLRIETSAVFSRYHPQNPLRLPCDTNYRGSYFRRLLIFSISRGKILDFRLDHREQIFANFLQVSLSYLTYETFIEQKKFIYL